MSDFNYLVAIALIEQEGKRLMPIGGKSLKRAIPTGKLPDEEGETICLELLLRVLQRSNEGPLKQANGNKSIFLLETSIGSLQESLPKLKAEWVNRGDTNLLILELLDTCDKMWNITFIKGTGIRYDFISKQS